MMPYPLLCLALLLGACQIILPVGSEKLLGSPVLLPDEPELFLRGAQTNYLGQDFTLKKAGRVLRLQVWLKGPEPNTDLTFSIHKSRDSNDFMLDTLAIGAIAELEGTRLGTLGRKATIRFTPQPILEAGKRFAWVVRTQKKAPFFLRARPTTDKENLAHHSGSGWARFYDERQYAQRFDHVLEVGDAD